MVLRPLSAMSGPTNTGYEIHEELRGAKTGYHFCYEISSGQQNVDDDLVDLLVCCYYKVLLICFFNNTQPIDNDCVQCVWGS